MMSCSRCQTYRLYKALPAVPSVRPKKTHPISTYPSNFQTSSKKINMIKVLLFVSTMFISRICGATMPEGGCSCAVFPENVPTPIIVQSLQYNVTCDEEGSDICQQLCMALAKGAKDKAPAMICAKLDKHVDNMTVSVYTKSCFEEDWKFTGLKSPEPICCHAGKEATCATID